jgi:hypothetical protein
VVIQYSFYPCDQEREDLVQSGVMCEVDPVKIKSFFKGKSLNLGWIEYAVGVNASDLDETTALEPELGVEAYFLKPLY